MSTIQICERRGLPVDDQLSFTTLATLIRGPTQKPSVRRAFTIVELLAVIAIIGILISLMLPAIQAARETSRAMQCKNNLKQLGLSALHHEMAHGYFPSGGWGWNWVGDPDRGFDSRQPGGWVYNVLPFIEQKGVWSVGKGIIFATHGAEKKLALIPQIATPVTLMYCPARRTAEAYPYTAREGQPVNCRLPSDKLVGKSDYAANCGDQDAVEFNGGPDSFGAVDDGTFVWRSTSKFTGIVFARSRVTIVAVRDGASKTLLFGEKALDTTHYTDGQHLGDNECATSGCDNDTLRTGCPFYPPSADSSFLQDGASRFGSAHAQQFYTVFCDGSIHGIGFEIAGEVFGNLCNRNDGRATSSNAVQ